MENRKDTIALNENTEIAGIDSLCQNSIDLIRYARGLIVQHINIIELMTYYALGKWIIEVQQAGNDRAKYGDRVIDQLSEALTEEFGRGYSRETLRNARKFYQVYQERISQTLFTEFIGQKSQTLFGKLKKENPFRLSWSHYLILMRAKSPEERDFYEIEAADGNWSVRTLQRQYGSSLYERLLLSTDKDKVKELAEKGHIIEKSQDVVKDPLVLEFLGLQEKPSIQKRNLKHALSIIFKSFLWKWEKDLHLLIVKKGLLSMKTAT